MLRNRTFNQRLTTALLSLIAALILSLSLFAQNTGPAITVISPDSGAPGSVVTIVGSGFGASPASASVTFNGAVATPKKWSDTSITVVIPAGASTGPVLISVAGAASNAVKFTVSQTQ